MLSAGGNGWVRPSVTEVVGAPLCLSLSKRFMLHCQLSLGMPPPLQFSADPSPQACRAARIYLCWNYRTFLYKRACILSLGSSHTSLHTTALVSLLGFLPLCKALSASCDAVCQLEVLKYLVTQVRCRLVDVKYMIAIYPPLSVRCHHNSPRLRSPAARQALGQIISCHIFD